MDVHLNCGSNYKGRRYVTVRSAANALGIKYHALLRAVNAGDVPSYRPFNSRRLVCLDDIQAVIAAHRVGAQHDQ